MVLYGRRASMRLDIIKRSNEKRGFSEEWDQIQFFPDKSRLDEAKWHMFAVWCDQRLINVSEAAINTATELQASKKSLAPSTLEGYCSAIADIMSDMSDMSEAET